MSLKSSSPNSFRLVDLVCSMTVAAILFAFFRIVPASAVTQAMCFSSLTISILVGVRFGNNLHDLWLRSAGYLSMTSVSIIVSLFSFFLFPSLNLNIARPASLRDWFPALLDGIGLAFFAFLSHLITFCIVSFLALLACVASSCRGKARRLLFLCNFPGACLGIVILLFSLVAFLLAEPAIVSK